MPYLLRPPGPLTTRQPIGGAPATPRDHLVVLRTQPGGHEAEVSVVGDYKRHGPRTFCPRAVAQVSVIPNQTSPFGDNESRDRFS